MRAARVISNHRRSPLMHLKYALIAGLAGAGLALTAFAAEPAARPRGPEAEIHFANLGGIWDWRADGDKGLYVQGRDRQWYYATLMSPCFDLPFAERVGFVTEPGGDFDKFSAILVNHHDCQVISLVKS